MGLVWLETQKKLVLPPLSQVQFLSSCYCLCFYMAVTEDMTLPAAVRAELEHHQSRLINLHSVCLKPPTRGFLEINTKSRVCYFSIICELWKTFISTPLDSLDSFATLSSFWVSSSSVLAVISMFSFLLPLSSSLLHLTDFIFQNLYPNISPAFFFFIPWSHLISSASLRAQQPPVYLHMLHLSPGPLGKNLSPPARSLTVCKPPQQLSWKPNRHS